MVQQFLNTFNIEGTKFEFTSINKGKVSVLSLEEALNNKTSNIYFLGGIREDLVYGQGIRSKDSDIVKKRYFCIDIDMRKSFKEESGDECSDEDIISEGYSIIETLKDNEYFSEWKYVIFSGNGLHIYYVSDEQVISKKDYASGVGRIYRQWDKIMGSKIYYSDHACKNIARILRLPGSINQKNGAEVKILAEQDSKSRLFDLIPEFAKQERYEEQERNFIKQKEIQDRLVKYGDGGNQLYETINSIPAWQICQLLIPQFPFDGRKNFKNEKGGFCGYFYNAEDNTIINGGSRFFNWGNEESGWNCYSLVKRYKGWSDKEVFLYFKTILKIK